MTATVLQTPLHARRASLVGLVASAVLAALLSLYTTVVEARPNVHREGVQVEGLIGGSNCMPGLAACEANNAVLSGATRGSVGGGVALGWRARPWVLVGAMYRGGMFRPDYEIVGFDSYQGAAQHSVYAVLRPILPVWRFDLGVNLAPGYSRQVFWYGGATRDYTQGFSFAVGPVVDLYVGKHVFLGFEADFLLNAHRRVCAQRSDGTVCVEHETRYRNPVHQAIYGLHIGFNAG